MEQQTAANPILEVAVGLTPVPGLREPAGNGAVSFAAMMVYHRDDKAKIGLSDNSVAVGEKHVHITERTRVKK